MVRERLLRLQEEFTQLAPDLLRATTGLNQRKDSVGRLKRRPRVRQTRHGSQSLQSEDWSADPHLPVIDGIQHCDHVNATPVGPRSMQRSATTTSSAAGSEPHPAGCQSVCPPMDTSFSMADQLYANSYIHIIIVLVFSYYCIFIIRKRGLSAGGGAV